MAEQHSTIATRIQAAHDRHAAALEAHHASHRQLAAEQERRRQVEQGTGPQEPPS